MPIWKFIKDILIKLVHMLRAILLYLLVFSIMMVVLTSAGGYLLGLGEVTGINSKAELIRDEGGEDKIVIFPASGVILMESTPTLLGSTGDIITPEAIDKFLRTVSDDLQVKAVIIDINSPGGSPVASDRIFETIKLFKEKTQLPVIVAMGDLAASGGYYIAAAGDHIVANPATLTGSIGVIMETYNLEELYKKIGLKKVTFKQGEYKDILNEARDLTEEEEEIINDLNKTTYDMFVSRVAEGRDMSEDRVRSLATGQIYSGRQAKDLGLVDSLGNLDEAIYQAKAMANLERYQVYLYQDKSFFDEFLGGIQSSLQPLTQFSQILSQPVGQRL